MCKWASEGHFAYWLILFKDNRISGGLVLWKGMRKGNNRAGQMFRLAANSLHHNNTPLGAYLRRMKAKLGPAGGVTATARKIAIIFYTMVNNQVVYDATLSAESGTPREKRVEDKMEQPAPQIRDSVVSMQ